VVERRIDDIGLARRFRELGLAGFVLKSHYTSTAERARVVSGVVPEVRALGAIALNRAVGGLNPLAVEIAAREGARVVWLPTVDSINEAGELELKPGATPPVWVRLQLELRERGLPIEPISLDGALDAVLASVAAHGLVLATGHIGRDEVFRVVDAARAKGIEHVVVTHPDYPAQNFSADEQVELARRGAWIERCFTTPHTGKVSWEQWLESTRAVGAERCVLSTDLGQVANPPVEDGLALLTDRLLGAGFSDEEVRTMAVGNTRRIAGVS
jgi:Family of unknown function (DUF6282)